MNFTSHRSILIILFFFLNGCSSVPKVPIDPYAEMDKFHTDLAQRVQRSVIPGSKPEDFQVVVTQATLPIGTVLRVGTTIPVDYVACKFPLSIQAYPMPSMFPPFTLTKTTAISLGLDNKLIRELAEFGVEISDADQITLTVENAGMQTLSDNDLSNLVKLESCKNAISPGPVWIVRGYIVGKRHFLLKKDSSRLLKVKLKDMASVKININPANGALEITDVDDSGFLQIISKVTPPTVHTITTAMATPLGNIATNYDIVESSFEKPQLESNESGKIFIQRIRSGTNDDSKEIIAILRGGTTGEVEESTNVSNIVADPTIKFFNIEDRSLAEEISQKVRKKYPEVNLMRTPLPAPPGQIEVWLP